MKIYTRKGDTGKSKLLGGTEVNKNDFRIEAYGTIDELISWLGLLRSQKIDEYDRNVIFRVQGMLMNICAHLANEKRSPIRVQMTEDKDVKWLEDEIDRIDNRVPPLNSFIIPGGHTVVSYCHIARSVSRRAERRLIPVLQNDDAMGAAAMKFLNRLSDFLFMLSRKIASDLNCEENIWNKHP